MRVVIYDAGNWSHWNADDLISTGRLYRELSQYDYVIPALTWEHALGALLYFQDNSIDDLHVWCAGMPGAVAINRESVTGCSINPYFWSLLGSKINPRGRLWFRASSVFAGEHGHVFAKNISNTMNRTVVGHTHVINFFQSGLRYLHPGCYPSWSTEEGIIRKADGTLELRASGIFRPSTVTCLHSDF